jgi:rare lipoprotein A
MRAIRFVMLVVTLGLTACAPPEAARRDAAPEMAPKPPAGTPAIERGRVSLYGHEFAGRTTASGERFDPEALTMAHRTLPFGTRVRVTSLVNQRSVEVVVNDRGPAVRGRIADLSLAAARRLGMATDGVIDAMLEIVAPATARSLPRQLDGRGDWRNPLPGRSFANFRAGKERAFNALLGKVIGREGQRESDGARRGPAAPPASAGFAKLRRRQNRSSNGVPVPVRLWISPVISQRDSVTDGLPAGE